MHQLVPAFILEQVELGCQQGSLQGTAMFVDLSGFSVMADALGKHGHHGSEILAAIMQSIFEPLIDSIYAQDGFVIGYAGDAITAFFVQTDEPERSPVSGLHGISAALAIQQHFVQDPVHRTAFGDFRVAAKIGLAFGEAAWQILYSGGRHRATYVFTGASLAECAEAEKQAIDATLHSLHEEDEGNHDEERKEEHREDDEHSLRLRFALRGNGLVQHKHDRYVLLLIDTGLLVDRRQELDNLLLNRDRSIQPV